MSTTAEPIKCACVAHDAYDCWRSRYQLHNSDEDVRHDGGPCDCYCHDIDEDEDEYFDDEDDEDD